MNKQLKMKPTGYSNVEPLFRNTNRFEKLNIALLNSCERKALIDLALDVLAERHKYGVALTKPDETQKYLRLEIGSLKNEVFGVIFLNNKHCVIKSEVIFTGTIDSASVYPRVVVQRVLDLNAAAVIFYHNHPSGSAEPSQSDQNITSKLKNALNVIDVRVLDHYVVSTHDSVSFAERGLM